MSNELIDWLNNILDVRGWSQRELARRSGVSQTTISNVLSAKQLPTWDFCASISHALGVTDDEVLIIAGLKKPPPPAVAEEDECIQIFRSLPATTRNTIMAMMRGLLRQQAVLPWGVNEARPAYSVDNYLIQELLAEFERVPEEWRGMVIQQARQYRLMANTAPRIIGEEPEETPNEKKRNVEENNT